MGLESVMRYATGLASVMWVAACGGQTVQLGGTKGDGGGADHSVIGPPLDSGGAGGDSGVHIPPTPNACKGSGANRDAGATAGNDGASPAQPATCSGSYDCVGSDVCIVLLGSVGEAGVPGHCGSACQSDCDCPAWFTCQSGVCAQCSSCPAGQQCVQIGSPGGACLSNTACPLGEYCAGDGCQGIEVCTTCLGGCSTCTSNTQCDTGQVCVGTTCQPCTSDSQCGPSGHCTATHMGMQCTCSTATDCASNEICSSGVCSPGPTTASTACMSGPLGPNCPTGWACINGTCGACTRFEDCNTSLNGSPGNLTGLACINGTCTNCTANDQCGGGQACIGGTCGTCSTNSQCGVSGQCSNGYCVCTNDSQCASGQRCGSGVCVEM
jgi:hypothetical protein